MASCRVACGQWSGRARRRQSSGQWPVRGVVCHLSRGHGWSGQGEAGAVVFAFPPFRCPALRDSDVRPSPRPCLLLLLLAHCTPNSTSASVPYLEGELAVGAAVDVGHELSAVVVEIVGRRLNVFVALCRPGFVGLALCEEGMRRVRSGGSGKKLRSGGVVVCA